eukprot:scaffold65528_cov69-Attheya_sp.AAC.3
MLRDGDHPTLMSYPPVVTTTPTDTPSTDTQPTPTDTQPISVQDVQPTAVHSDHFNLSIPQKELLRWHTRLGHVGFKPAKLITVPKCASCLFGKQKSRTTPGRRITHVRDETGHIRSDQFTPGQKVSVDHYICSTKGRLFTSYGKTDDNSMYSVGCIFVDHASGYVHNEFQAQMNMHQTLKSKEAFEAHCCDVGVTPVEYLTDNGSAFTSSGFTDQLKTFSQIVRFAGTGAHHQNALAERTIGTIMAISRTMLMHGATHWPHVIESSLCPMAVSHAIFIWNRMPDPINGLSPIPVMSTAGFTTCMFGAVQCMYWTNGCQMARRFPVGSHAHSA